MRITRTTPARLVLPALATGALLLSGCGSTAEPAAAPASASTPTSAGSESPVGEPGNSTDIDFAAGMIPHHGQAIEMAELALTKAESPKIKELATQVKAAQAPEITTLSGLLESWGEEVPAATGHSGSMAGMDHGDSGMMTSEQMTELHDAAGGEFDRMWLDMMIAHHEGAVAMSETALRDGADARIQQLAKAVADAQTKEIAELESLRADLS